VSQHEVIFKQYAKIIYDLFCFLLVPVFSVVRQDGAEKFGKYSE